MAGTKSWSFAQLRLLLLRAAAFFLILLTVSCQARGVIKNSQFPGQDRAVPESIVIVNWNAQKGADAQFRSDLARVIIERSPDFVFVQEARADLLDTKRIGGHFASSWSYPWPDGRTIGLLT